jgi:hypothetical protein
MRINRAVSKRPPPLPGEIATSLPSTCRETTRARRVQGAAGSHPVARPQAERETDGRESAVLERRAVEWQSKNPSRPWSEQPPGTTPVPGLNSPPERRGPAPGPWSDRIRGRDRCVDPALTVRMSAPPGAAIDPIDVCSTTPKVPESMPVSGPVGGLRILVGALTHLLSRRRHEHCRATARARSTQGT